MQKHLFVVSCPCCGTQIEVDTRTGKARAVRPEEQKAGDIDKLVRAQQKESQRLGNLFDDAKQQQNKQAERLDDVLEQAKQDAKKDKDKKPRNIFDLD